MLVPTQQQVGYSATENIRTWANFITLGRMIIGVIVFAVAARSQSATWNYVGLALYWSLDMLDGFVARRFNQETRLGAQLDILVDRLLISFFYFNVLRGNPGLLVPIMLFLIQFMVLDHYLSNQFLRWPIRSPNYFYVVDPLIWQLNWSMVGKTLNTGLITVLLLTTTPLITLVAIGVVLGLKLYSCVRLQHLPPPPGSPAVAE